MQGTARVIHPEELRPALGVAGAPLVIDVRRPADFDPDGVQIVGSIRCPPDEVEQGLDRIRSGAGVVVYGHAGASVSQGVAAQLAAIGVDAAYLLGGITAWREHGLPTRRRIGAAPGKWVTRERPTIDRIACPWLIRRFIDPEAELVYVPAARVREAAEEIGATPYDIPNVEFGHHGEFCSFDAFIDKFAIADRALDRLAMIVRGADTDRLDLTPQSAGLLAISQGLKANIKDDHTMLAQGMVVYDALYSWCRAQGNAGPR
jgi:rhodanese-related sulfurtransferase